MLDVWVASVSVSSPAVFNGLWFVAERYGFVPDRVYLLWNESVVGQLEAVRRAIGCLGGTYGRRVEVVADESVRVYEEDIDGFRRKVGELLKSLGGVGRVVVDITPGRKFMSSLMLAAGMEHADHVVYLFLRDLGYADSYLFHIPFSLQKLVDLRALFKGGAPLSGERVKGERVTVKVCRRDLMVFLNSLYLDGRLVHDVRLGGVKLGRFTLKLEGNEVSFNVECNDFCDETHGDFSLVREVILASGMARFSNEEEAFGEVLNEIKRSSRTVYVGFDTNSLVFRVPSRFLEYVRRAYAGMREREPSINFVISGEVINEVSRNVNQKLPVDPKLGDYSNQLTPRARLFMVAQGERRLLDDRNSEVVEAGGDARGDEKIALEYKEFASKKGNVVVFTTDSAAYMAMDSFRRQGLIPVKLDLPSMQGPFRGRWEDARDLLYYLSVVLGEINVSPYRFRGVWRGKSPDDWRRELVELSNFEYSRILELSSKLLAEKGSRG
ncbi:MAG: hypothetical protein QW566_08205 [Candidatus Jordarchaeales archaeon]